MMNTHHHFQCYCHRIGDLQSSHPHNILHIARWFVYTQSCIHICYFYPNKIDSLRYKNYSKPDHSFCMHWHNFYQEHINHLHYTKEVDTCIFCSDQLCKVQNILHSKAIINNYHNGWWKFYMFHNYLGIRLILSHIMHMRHCWHKRCS